MSTNPNTIPPTCDVVIIGGGPAGSSAATLLARDGIHVVLFDKVKHPRPAVGESIIPHFWPYADRLGVADKIVQDGFLPKAGGIVVWEGKIQQIRFTTFDPKTRGGLHVERDRFDQLLLQHSAENGAAIYEEVAVRSVDFSNPHRPCVIYDDRRGAASRAGHIACRYVIDASGPHALLASQFNARKLVKGDDRYLGLWGYYKDSRYVGFDRKVHNADSVRAVKPVTFVTSYEHGWAWHIILRDSTSVGLVMNTDAVKGKGRKGQEQYFRETCERRIPYLRDLLKPATFIEDSMFFRPDYSYYSETVCGDGFFCVGDAAAFVDPIFSQGVVAALFNASIAHWAIKATLKNERRKAFYQDVFQRKLLGFYGFARLMAFGDFGGEGIDPELVKAIVRSQPRHELELSLSAATTNLRSENIRRIAREAGLLDEYGEDFAQNKAELLTDLNW